MDKLAELTDGYTGADIAALVNAAAMSAIKDQISSGDKNNITTGHKQHLTISMKHMEAGLQKISKIYEIQRLFNLPHTVYMYSEIIETNLLTT